MVCLPEFKAGRAELCRMEKINDAGAGMVYYVKLPDGYLIDCGSSRGSSERAEAIVGLVNALMRWAGHWPPTGDMTAILENNFIDEMRWRVSRGEPIPDLGVLAPSPAHRESGAQ
jgi:hypothetical protein